MQKTVRVGEETHRILQELREKEHVETFEELIRLLIVRSGAVDAFGKDPDLPRWHEEEDRASFHEE